MPPPVLVMRPTGNIPVIDGYRISWRAFYIVIPVEGHLDKHGRNVLPAVAVGHRERDLRPDIDNGVRMNRIDQKCAE